MSRMPIKTVIYTAKKSNFTFRIFSVNVTKSAVNEGILNGKLRFLCSVRIKYLEKRSKGKDFFEHNVEEA